MTFAPWRSLARAILRRSEMERDMDSELEFHVEARTDHLVAMGLDRAAAARRARLELGDPLRWKEQGREAHGLRLIDQLRADVRYGLRWLRRSPAFAATTVFSIAVGIGANTAIFSVATAVLRTLIPVDHPESLVILSRSDDPSGLASSFSYPFFQELQGARTLGSAIARASFEPNVEAGDASERVSAEMVSGNYFEVLGVRPHLGRLFTADDNRIEGRHPLAVLSHAYWQRRYGGDPQVVGTLIRVNTHPMTIVGVTPRTFTGIEAGVSPSFYVPMVMQADMLGSASRLENPGEWWLQIIGRTPNRDARQTASTRLVVQSELDAIYQRSLAQIAGGSLQERHLVVRDGSRGQPALQNRVTRPLVVLSALAAGVLLLVCLNIASLMLARTMARRRELAVRIALGATRGRIVGQLLVETLLVAMAGGGLGIFFAKWAARGLVSLAVPAAAVSLLDVTLDLQVMLLAVALSVVVGLVCGLWPSVAAQHTDPALALSTGGRTVAGRRAVGRRLLVAAQIALSFALLTGAGLFARTLINLQGLDFGFDTEHLLSARLDATLSGYSKPQLTNFLRDVCDRVAALPGVQSVSFAAIPLLNRSSWGSGITLDTGVRDDRPGPERNAVGPRYFTTVGFRIVAGREFTDRDVASSPKAAVVNEAFAQKYLAGHAIGRRIGPGGSHGSADFTVVGVVSNGRYAEVRENVAPFWYVPYQQLEPLGQSDTAVRITRGLLTLHVRTNGDPAAVANAVQGAAGAIDKRVTMFGIKTMRQQIADQLTLERLLAWLGVVFAVMALSVAALGLYGVVAYDTTARTREFGVRIALGATPLGILTLAFRQSARLIVAGSIVGVLLSVAGTGYVRSLLYGLQGTNPLLLGSVAIVVVAVTGAAALVPTLRVTKIDPIKALQ